MPAFDYAGSYSTAPAPDLGRTIIGAVINSAGKPGGGKVAASKIGAAVGSTFGPVGTFIGGLAGELAGGLVGTSSKANWNRTIGRLWLAGCPQEIARLLYRAWLAAGDSTGAKLWEKAVDVLGLQVVPGGTKEGYTRGAPPGKASGAVFLSYQAYVKG